MAAVLLLIPPDGRLFASGPASNFSPTCCLDRFPMNLRSLSIVAYLAALTSSMVAAVGGESLLPAEQSIAAAIDHYIGEAIDEDGIAAVGLASDETLLRRTTLDLAGRIPTQAEQAWFQALNESERRQQLVDRLVQLPDAAYHTANELDAMLLPNKQYDNEFREYLLRSTKQNRGWEQMFRDMMLANATDGPLKGASVFLKSRIREVDDLTNDTAILFFGVNVSCAKCHDHPLVEDWKQDHFYGMQAFFSRTYQTKKNSIAEKFFDKVKFKTTAGDEKTASYMFLSGDTIADGTPAFSDEERKAIDQRINDAQKKDDSDVPVPGFSPRQRLIEISLRDGNDEFFAKNIVNRIWARMFGTGLVDPLDQMHSGNPPSHPELLNWLARDMKKNGYDLPRLLRGIALSDTYARSSEWTSTGDPPSKHYFAVAESRPLTPRQLAASLKIASARPNKWPAIDATNEWDRERRSLEDQANSWAREFELPGENFQIAVDEALFFSNSERVYSDLLRDSGDSLIGHLKQTEDRQQLVSTLWQVVLNRSPDEVEAEAALEWLERDGEDQIENIRQLAWTLLAGPEMRFNH